MVQVRRQHVVRVLLLLVVAGFLYMLLRPASGGPIVGETTPDFQLSDLDGRTLHLSGYRGKIVVLNFWATWCAPCLEEMPSLDRFAEQFVPKGVAVLAVSVDDDEQALRQFVAKNQLKMTVLRDPDRKISSSYQTFKYPETYILDRQGRFVQKVIGGANWNGPEIVSFFEQLLSKP
jgi:peroxiredoxin